MDNAAGHQNQEEEEQQELFLYDGPIDPETEEAIQTMNDAGAKAFALQDYELAVEKFGLASEMLGQVYGETNTKCADTLFMYGKALLEHAIQQSSVLGGVTEKKSNKELEAVVAAATGGAVTGSSSSSAPSNPRFVFEGDEDDDEDEEEGEDGQEGGAEGGEGDDQDDFAVAWDVLDLARVLFHRMGTEEALLKLGDVHIALGDVSLESENFEQAVNDYREAITIKEARLEPDDRQLAEAHYKLALALEYSPNESALAQEHIHKASNVLKDRIQKLNGLLASGKGKARAVDASENETKMAAELVELHELVGEMEQKTQDLIANMNKKAPVEGQTQLEMLNDILVQQKTQSAIDISSLIKPKSTKPATATGSPSSSSSPAPAPPAEAPPAAESTATEEEATPAASEESTETNQKRKADELDESEEADAEKKPKVFIR
ncbi:hypothetical protein BGZ95_006370 [Linnemannia exigua]|uniref:Tetratricopeptide SHNi-TPR domain-containing protein n=1 Tax=Linnemannia exigua TaxID=604196 RepID=A0AAD4H8P3_9FUNG|nr:hypothetical protein BGZ95_006370 [Linnemannia exigua]